MTKTKVRCGADNCVNRVSERGFCTLHQPPEDSTLRCVAMCKSQRRCPKRVYQRVYQSGVTRRAVCLTHISQRRYCHIIVCGRRCYREVGVTGYTRSICPEHERAAAEWTDRYGHLPGDVLLAFALGDYVPDVAAAIRLLNDDLAASLLESNILTCYDVSNGEASGMDFDRHRLHELDADLRRTFQQLATSQGLTGAEADAWVDDQIASVHENVTASEADSTRASKDRALTDLADFLAPLGYDLAAPEGRWKPLTVPLLLAYITDRIKRGNLRTGEPLTSSYLRATNHAVREIHTARGISDSANPANSAVVLSTIRGYGKRQDRPAVRATPFTKERIYQLVSSINLPRDADLRDVALVTLVGNPAHPMSWDGLAALTWEDVVLPPPSDPVAPMRLDLGGRIGHVDVPQRGLHDGSICPVAAMRTLLGAADHDHAGGYDPAALVFGGVGAAALKKRFDRSIANANAMAAGNGSPAIDPAPAAPRNVKRGLNDAEIAFVVSTLETDALEASRDTAVLLVGWWGSLRVGEIASINLHWLVTDENTGGYLILLHSSKTDTEHRGRWVELPRLPLTPDGQVNPLCPAVALDRWLAARINAFGLTDEQPGLNGTTGPSYAGVPLFVNIGSYRGRRTTPAGFQRLIQRVAEVAGIEPRIGERISWHGNRSGFATHALMSGVSAPVVAYLQRRSDVDSLMAYCRPDSVASLLSTLDAERTTAPVTYPTLEEVG